MADRSRSRATVVALLLLTAGCTSTSPSPVPATTPTAADGPSTAAQATIDAINATAGGDVAVQQEVLRRLVDPARAAEQAACAPASITIRIDPAMDRLERLADLPTDAATDTTTAVTETSTGAGGADTSIRFRLPVLLEVYTGAVRTGTDLAGLELTLVDGVAHTAPLCLR